MGIDIDVDKKRASDMAVSIKLGVSLKGIYCRAPVKGVM